MSARAHFPLFEYDGKRFDIVELGTKYDYSGCGDPVWKEASEQEAKWGAKKKERETFLKALPGPVTLDDTFNNVKTTIVPPSKTSSKGIKITFQP